jgi:hypothetical protein
VSAVPELTPELVARVLNMLASGLAAGYAVPCGTGAGARGGGGHAQTETRVGRGDAAPLPDAAGRDGGQEDLEGGGAGAGVSRKTWHAWQRRGWRRCWRA